MRNVALLCVLLLCFSASAQIELRSSRVDGALVTGVWGDFDGDGLDDVLRHNQLQWNIGGRLTAPFVVTDLDAQDSFLLDAVDLNSDGYADLIQRIGDSTADRVLLGDGQGGFTEQAWPAQYGSVVKAADFTSDGIPDLLTVRPGKLTILSNDGAAGFTMAQELTWTDRNLYPSIGIGDLNGDGLIDFAIASETRVYLYYSDSRGVFGEPRVRFTRRPFGELAIADITGDARADLAGLHTFEGNVSPLVLTGDGAGRLPGALRLRVDSDFMNESFVVGDFVPGGAKEIAYAEPNGTVHLLEATNGQIRELGKVTIDAAVKPWVDNIGPKLSVRRFRSADRDDLIVQAYSMDVYANPPARVWLIDAQGSVAPVARAAVRGRTRAVAGHASRIGGEYNIRMLSSSCPIPLSSVRLEQEGMFLDVGLSDRIRGAEAIYAHDKIWMRLSVLDEGGVSRVVSGYLRPSSTGFEGTLFEDEKSPCGVWAAHRVVLEMAR